MIETLTLLGGALGAVMRLLPEVFKLFTLKRDQDHEFRMSELQLKIDSARATQEIDKIHANEMLEAMRGEMSAYVEAIKGQSRLTGNKFIDGLNQSVRPVLTYWWMVLFTVYKFNVIWNSKTYDEFIINLWTKDDGAILSMIIGFWFVDRAIKWLKR
jgi:hypothetical protein